MYTVPVTILCLLGLVMVVAGGRFGGDAVVVQPISYVMILALKSDDEKEVVFCGEADGGSIISVLCSLLCVYKI